MSSAVGDRDGLMGAILALTAPPVSGSDKNKTDKSGAHKKSSRTQPKEVYCEGCGDSGEILLTCYECSITSYHPVCDDPPLEVEESEVKDFRWQCRGCRIKNMDMSDDDDLSKSAEGKLEEMESLGNDVCNPLGISDDEADEKEGKNEDKVTPVEEKDVLMTPIEEEPAVDVEGNAKDEEKKQNDPNEIRRKSTNLRKLIKVAIHKAKVTNPVLFELPKSFQTNPYNFPGTSRSAIKRLPGAKVKPAFIELENYCTPRPLACCFKCGSSCRTAPLMHCDYCPKYFHFDCLTPPLTTPPVGLWMCPLHVEHFMEATMLGTSWMSERVALWGFTNRQVNRSSVELKFLSKCGRKNPPFSRKIPWPPKQRFSLEPGNGHISTPNNMDESNSVVPFMDKAKLKSLLESSMPNRDLYLCYSDAIDDFAQVDLDGTDFASQDEIFSRISSINDQLETESPIKQGVTVEEEADSIPKQPVATPEIIDVSLPEDRNKSLDDSSVGIDVLLEAASMSTPKIGSSIINNNNKGHLNGPLISNFENHASKMSIQYSLTDTTPALLEILFVDQKRKLSIYEPQVFFGTGKCDHQNTAVIDPSDFVDCPRLSNYHAMLFFDMYRKQWEILNYSKHGISVDCTRYTLRQKPKKVHKTNNLQTIKDEILKRRKILINQEYHIRPAPAVLSSEFMCECYEHEISRCTSTIDNEGSAPIYQYSQIQIGCLRMIVGNVCGKSQNVVTGIEYHHPQSMSESIQFDNPTK